MGNIYAQGKILILKDKCLSYMENIYHQGNIFFLSRKLFIKERQYLSSEILFQAEINLGPFSKQNNKIRKKK
jgi:hypothetical protein